MKHNPIGKRSYLNPFKLTPDSSEHEIQIGVVEWCKIASVYGLELANDPMSYDDPDYCITQYKRWGTIEKLYVLKWIFAVPNGGMRSVVTRQNLNREGVAKGYPDLGLDVASHSYHGFRMELKRAINSRVYPEQVAWRKFHLEQGYYSVICYSFIEARNEIVRYLQ